MRAGMPVCRRMAAAASVIDNQHSVSPHALDHTGINKMGSLSANVTHTIKRYGMLRAGDMVLAAVSGGPDSMAMLHVLVELADVLGVRLAVAHLDHGLRQDSIDDAMFVAEAANSLGLPCIVGEAHLAEVLQGGGANVQEAARDARYGFLQRTAEELGADRIAVGHTVDDQAETYLMRELRGSGAHGLAGIPPVRGNIIRPLIDASRTDVMAYLEGKGVSYVTDPTNLKPKYLRNKVRLELMPVLKGYNPNIARTLARSADILRDEDLFMDSYAESLLPGLTASDGGWVVRLTESVWAGLPLAVKRRVVRLLAGRLKGDQLGIGYEHVEDALGVLDAGATGRGVDLPGGVRVESSYGMPVFYRPDGMPSGFEYPMPVPGIVDIPGIGSIVAGPAPYTQDGVVVEFDMDRLAGPLSVRSRRPGDRFNPAGMSGTRKLKEFFIDMKLSRIGRAQTPILTCGGEIAWVVGIRPDGRFVAGPDTKNPLAVRFLPGMHG